MGLIDSISGLHQQERQIETCRDVVGYTVSGIDVLDFSENDPEEAFEFLFHTFSFKFGVELRWDGVVFDVEACVRGLHEYPLVIGFAVGYNHGLAAE